MQGHFTRSRKGFTLSELLAAISIIGVIASITVPNFQRAREDAIQFRAETTLASICVDVRAYVINFGKYPDDICELIDAGALIIIDEKLDDGRVVIDGYEFDLVVTPEEIAAYVDYLRELDEDGNAIADEIENRNEDFLLFARPVESGRTGCDLMFQVDCETYGIPDPNCGKRREVMLSNINKYGLEATGILLLSGLDEDGNTIANQVIPDLTGPQTTEDIFHLFDKNNDGEVTFAEFDISRTTLAPSDEETSDPVTDTLFGFVESTLDEMRIGAGGEDIDDVGLTVDEWIGDPAGLFSAAALCDLTYEYATNRRVARALCRKLRNAEAALANGYKDAAVNKLNAYQNQVQAQTGEALSQEQAEILDVLAEVLKFAE